ncbi:muts domain V-domain-containing protein [Scenedesmus sp. NREL 46B-D3]|nr:muts domain V-domain-containing protein [Scenedesmus sp. NREL 46B-D3]
MAAAAPGAELDLGGGAGDTIIGRRIKVFWPKEKAWFEGTIQAYKDSKHRVLYDDDDEEWLDLSQERHRLLRKGGPGAAAAAARKKRKAVLASDDEDDAAADADDAQEASDSDSDFLAAGADEDSEEAMDDWSRRQLKMTMTASSRKRSTSLSTPAGKAAAGRKPRTSSISQPPSSAGHTPMDRLSCGFKATPQQGFPGFTPPPTVGGDGGTPSAKLGLFKSAGKGSRDAGLGIGGAGGRCTPSPLPGGGSSAALQGALDLTPAAEGAKAEPSMVLGVLASGGAEAARFAARMAERFPFLHPNSVSAAFLAGRIKDKEGRRPDDPEYNARTLQIPNAASWFKQAKVTEAQQQWWNFKADSFDSVLLFKVGKFYEMFEMDAFVGVDVLGLSFMKGEQPHAGFPEAAYHGMAEQLARAGYRVVVVEQTETPEQLRLRNSARKPGQKAASVVQRQAVAVLSRGTLMDPEMVAGHPDAAYVLAAAGQVLLGSWRDDEVRRTRSAHSRVDRWLLGWLHAGAAEAAHAADGAAPCRGGAARRGSGAMSATTSRLVRCGGSRGPAPALNELPASSADAGAALQALASHFPEGKLPAVLEQLQQQYEAGQQASQQGNAAAAGVHAAKVAEAGLGAFGLLVQFLSSNMLEAALLPNARYEPLCAAASGSDEPVAMELNGAALEGLEILENALGGTQGSLLGLLDHCCTSFGRRRLRRWLTRPLYRNRDIERRQDAVEELMGSAGVAVGAARRALAGCSDLERCLARLSASVGKAGSGSGAGGFGREAAHVVLYEDMAKRRVKVLVGAMRDLQALQEALQAFGELSLSSELLSALADPERWTDFQARLGDMQVTQTRSISRCHLPAYLSRVRKQLDCRAISFVSVNKDSHVLEVPETACGSVPPVLLLAGQKKGFKRYSSEELQGLVAARQAREEEREAVQSGVLQALERLFVSHSELWCSAIEAVAVLDCLMALAGAAQAADGEMCRPKLLDAAGSDGAGVFCATQLRHPAGLGSSSCGSFVPNDIELGGSAPGFILLTGPNMGGKSTLLRQVCLAAVLAQVGAMVPAQSLQLTPMDGCFVRMGARDAILSGQSTFFIEMAETAAMLSRASSRSLVALDELGRGTATLDGAAIAAAVLDHLVHSTRCCGLFATHYHQLAAEHAADPQVAIMHMACAVAEQPEQQQQQDEEEGSSRSAAGESGVAEVTFLYKLTSGACPKSYGTNVARLAGLPGSVCLSASKWLHDGTLTPASADAQSAS